jgi:hypothetical protein
MTETASSRPELLSVVVLIGAFMLSSATVGQTISGTGTRDCSAFNAAIEQDSNVAIDSFLSWAQGFISGFNAGNRRGADIAIDHAGLFHWLASYCRTNPETPFYQAIQQMVGMHSH